MKRNKPLIDLRINVLKKTFRMFFGASVESFSEDEEENTSGKRLSKENTFNELSDIEKSIDSLQNDEILNGVETHIKSTQSHTQNQNDNDDEKENMVFHPSSNSLVLNKADIVENEESSGISITDDNNENTGMEDDKEFVIPQQEDDTVDY